MALKLVRKRSVYACKGSSPIIEIMQDPIVIARAPTTADQAQLGTIWCDTAANGAYILVDNANSSNTWVGVDAGSGSFATLSVSGAVTFSNANKLNGVLLTNGSGVVTASNAALGSILAGAGVGTTPSFATLTSSDHTISIDASVAGNIDLKIPSGGSHWSVVSAAVNPMEVNHGYVVDNVTAGARVDLTLPASAVAGSIINVALLGTTFGWRIIQGANQQIRLANGWATNRASTVGAGGYVDCINLSTAAISDYASLEMVCVTADLEWNIISSTGQLNLV